MELYNRMPQFNGHAHAAATAAPIRPAACRGLLLGWDKEPVAAGSPVLYEGDAPLLTCGMTGSGKGRGALIPTLLIDPRSVIAIDLKAELFHVCARRRLEMGHTVVALDPCGLATRRSDSLNPLDLMTLPRANSDADAQMLATLLAVGHHNSQEPFWDNAATSLISGLIAHIATAYPPAERSLAHLRAWLYHDDLEMTIATVLDKGIVKSRFARDQLVAYLTAPGEQTRPCIRAMACSHINALCAEQAAATLSASTFRLRDLYDGKPLSIFIIIPPDQLESLRPLWRLWIGTLLTAVMRRTEIPKQRTLFLLDECAQLGEMPALRQAVTLLRGYGLQVWSFWQELSQLRQCYPGDWQTMIHNAAVTQLFSVPNHLMAREWSELLGMEAARLAQLPREDAVVAIHGRGTHIVRRLDYLADPVFAGLYDANPRFAQIAAAEQPPNGWRPH
ncbi:MAG TPA: type IV secretory system conjugative DNA transfer family protein [Gemmataceae bacterium]|nr:type IV secretory system conjugative DNA transfer family protein [Gemmataceae bacterium]